MEVVIHTFGKALCYKKKKCWELCGENEELDCIVFFF